MAGGDLKFEEIEVALSNIGISLKCGGCASQFYTGFDEDHNEHCTRNTRVNNGEVSYCPICIGELVKKKDTGEGVKHCIRCERGFHILITSAR